MKYIAIVKRAKDSDSELHKELPGYHPVSCAEFGTYDEAKLAHPDSTILTVDQYQGYMHALQHVEEFMQSKSKAWWKLW